jgi:membrane protein required for colicin V production
MNALDMMILGLLGLTTACGLWKGLIRQIVILTGVICGYIISSRLYLPVARILPGSVEPATAKITSFIVIFILCIIAASVLGLLVDRILKIAGLGWANRLAGGLLGAVKGFIIVAILSAGLLAFLPADNGMIRTSTMVPYITSGIRLTSRIMPDDIRASIQKRIDEVKRLPGQSAADNHKATKQMRER